MARTFIPHESGRFLGVAIPKNRIDGRTLGLAVVVDDANAFDRSTFMQIRREASAAGVPILGRVPDPDRLIVVMQMPEDPAKVFVGLGNSVMDLRTERHLIDLRDDGEIIARFKRMAREWAGAGEGEFAPISLGRNLTGGEVTQRLVGRTFETRPGGDFHAEWERHKDGHIKGFGSRKVLFLRAETIEDYGLLARTLVARLDRGTDPIIREREIVALLDGARTPESIDMTMGEFRELIEQEVTAVAQIGGIANRDAATRLSMGFPAYSERSGMKLVRAQFSTPPAVGLAAAEFLKPDGRIILEPTIGNGVLAASSAARGAMVVGVEIDGDRGGRVSKAMGASARVSIGDALKPSSYPVNPVDRGGKFDALLANPPYMRLTETSTEDRGIKTAVDLKSLGFQFEAKTAETLIAAESIERLKSGGNAVFVMPAEMMKPTEINGHRRQFQALLNSSFGRVDSVVLDADLYSSMGSRFPVIVHFCEGKRTSDTVPPLSELNSLAPSHYQLVESYSEFYSFVDTVIESSAIKGLEADEVARNRAAWAALGKVELSAGADGAAPRDVGSDSAVRTDAVPKSSKSSSRSRSPGGEAAPRVSEPEPVADADPSPNDGDPETGNKEQDDPALSVDGSGYSFWTDDFEDDPFTAPYRPASKKPGVESVIERSMEAAMYAAMHRLIGEVGDVDVYVASKIGWTEADLIAPDGPLSPEQIDSVALTLRNREKGSATIIGDLMGVGKGRQLGAHMVSALIENRPIAAFTNKKHLFRDLIVRDFGVVAGRSVRDMIANGEVRPFIFNRDNEARLTEQDGKTVVFATKNVEVNQAKAAECVPEDCNLVVQTYSQYQMKSGLWRANALKRWIDVHAESGRPPVFLLDEVHEAAGEESWTGKVMRDVLDYARDRGASIVYSSATSMKSGRNIGIYKYALPDTGMSMEQLLELVEASPLEMQEILSSEMAREGRMLQRKMSSAGVERETRRLADIDPVRMDAAREMWRDFAEVLREMVEIAPAIRQAAKQQFERQLSGISHGQSGAGGLDVTTVSPASMFDNVSRYFLLSIKGRFLREMMEESIARGEKLALLQDLTGDTLGEYVRSGALLDEALDEEVDQSDQPDGEADPDAGDARSIRMDGDGQIVDAHPHIGHVLKRMVDRLVTAKGTDALGGRTVLTVDRFVGWAEEMKERIDRCGFEPWRVNTFDLAAEIAEDMGVGFEDITKRRLTFRTGDDGKVRVSNRTIPEKMATAFDYNRGEIDVIGLNNAASTGMSIQASPFEGPDVRRRMMLFMSFLKNIADHNQAEGRIDRKGQVVGPRYVIPNSGFVADDRLASLFNRGNRNLSSMTAATRESSRTINDVVDLLNPIGNMAVGMTLRANPALADLLGIKSDDKGNYGGSGSELGRQFLGRAFILGPEMSAAAINEVDMRYVSLVDKLSREGKNPLRLGHYDWKADVSVVDVLEEGDESARGLASQPLKLVEFSWEEDRPVEKPDRVLSDISEYIAARKEPFVRLDKKIALENALEYGHPNWSHPLFDELTGRSAFDTVGAIFPVPMSNEAMSELATALSTARDSKKRLREPGREWTAEDDVAIIRKTGEHLTALVDRALAFKVNPADNPEVSAEDRRRFRNVLDLVESSFVGKQPAFQRVKWGRALRMVEERVNAIAETRGYAGLIEPGRLVAVNARALGSVGSGLLGEALAEVGAFDVDQEIWLPAVVTSARYKDDRPLSAGGFNVSLSIPGAPWRIPTTVSLLKGALEVAGIARQGVIAPISKFTEMMKRDLHLPGRIYDRDIAVAVSMSGQDGRGLMARAMFGDHLETVVRAMQSYEHDVDDLRASVHERVRNDPATAQLPARERSVLIEDGVTRISQVVVEGPSSRNAAPAKLFDVLSRAVPQGKITKKRFGLTGNLLGAAAATMTKGRSKPLGEKAVVTNSDGVNVNTYLIPFGDAATIIKQVKERSATKSAVRGELTGKSEKVAAMLGLMGVVQNAAFTGAWSREGYGHIDLSDAQMAIFKDAVRELYPDALSTPAREKAWDDRESEILNDLVSRLQAAPKTFPPSLMTGGDVWAQAMVDQEAEYAKSSRRMTGGLPMPQSVSVRTDPEGRVTGAAFNLSSVVLNESVRRMDRNQLLVIFEPGMKGTVFLRKTHEGVKGMEGSVSVENVVREASTGVRIGDANMKLTKGLMALPFNLNEPDQREGVARFMVDASRAVTGLNAEFMAGGYGKTLLLATQAAIRVHTKAVDLSLMKENLGIIPEAPALVTLKQPAPNNEHVERRERDRFAPGA